MNYIDTMCFDNDRVDEYLDRYAKDMAAPMEKHLRRFYGNNITIEDFYKETESIRAFFHKRGDYIRSTRE